MYQNHAEKNQPKNKWDKLMGDLVAWRKLLRKQTGIGWNYEKEAISMDKEWWNKIKCKCSVIMSCSFFLNLLVLMSKIYTISNPLGNFWS